MYDEEENTENQSNILLRGGEKGRGAKVLQTYRQTYRQTYIQTYRHTDPRGS